MRSLQQVQPPQGRRLRSRTLPFQVKRRKLTQLMVKMEVKRILRQA
jgi:hypothetical protein